MLLEDSCHYVEGERDVGQREKSDVKSHVDLQQNLQENFCRI